METVGSRQWLPWNPAQKWPKSSAGYTRCDKNWEKPTVWSSLWSRFKPLQAKKQNYQCKSSGDQIVIHHLSQFSEPAEWKSRTALFWSFRLLERKHENALHGIRDKISTLLLHHLCFGDLLLGLMAHDGPLMAFISQTTRVLLRSLKAATCRLALDHCAPTWKSSTIQMRSCLKIGWTFQKKTCHQFSLLNWHKLAISDGILLMFRFIQIQICGVPLITRRNLQTIFDSESKRRYQSLGPPCWRCIHMESERGTINRTAAKLHPAHLLDLKTHSNVHAFCSIKYAQCECQSSFSCIR